MSRMMNPFPWFRRYSNLRQDESAAERENSEGVVPQPTIDVDYDARDEAGVGRCEKHRHAGKLIRLAIASDRNLGFREFLALFSVVLAPDLLAHDLAGRNAIDR